MKNKSLSPLKKLYCWMLLSMIVFILGGCGVLDVFSKLKPERFSQISITDIGGNSSTYTDESKITYFVEAFNSAEPTQTAVPTGALTEYRVSLEGKKQKHSREFKIYLDENLENRNLFMIIDDQSKRINDAYFNGFLTESVFEPVYAHRTPPQIVLNNVSGKHELEPNSYQWKFRKTDMNYYPADREQPESNASTSLFLDDSKLPEILTSDNRPDHVKWSLKQGDQVVYTSEDIQNDTVPLADGTYQCSLELQWLESENYGYFGSAQYHFQVQVDRPPEFNISSLKTYPGELLVITAANVNPDEKVEITTEIDFKPNIFDNGTEKVILLPVSYFHKENKTYQIHVSAGEVSETFAVEVMKKDFTTQYLTIDTKVAAATRNDQSALEVKEKIDPLRPVTDDEKYWEGPFIQPVEGGRVRPADFGKRRYVNNAPTSYRHNGLDIGQDEGTPVKAVNSGRVLIADYLIGTGYTVIIEHGYGLKSWYYHMVSLDTKTGDMVKKGDIIGYVGSTGFSTGPHLHLAISVNHVYVNPMPFFEEGVPLQ